MADMRYKAGWILADGHSKSLGVPRTLDLYGAGYERGNTRYPVFYLLHGHALRQVAPLMFK
jgi:hypothetical protein